MAPIEGNEKLNLGIEIIMPSIAVVWVKNLRHNIT